MPFIVIDGPDGAGKATQTRLLSDRLKNDGHDVLVMDFPRYGHPSAYFAEKYLRGEYGTLDQVNAYQASHFFALDRYDASHEIREALDRGTIVLSNRYVSANKGHQMAKMKDPEERQRFLDWINQLEYETHGIPIPDLTILLHVPAHIGYDLVAKKEKRDYLHGKARDIHESDLAYLQNTESAYLTLITMDTKENWVKIDCAPQKTILQITEIHEQIYNLISSTIQPTDI
ncbi:MAG: thymidylate kinase [bacterium]|nr:thymidylate kinase [bacterium]